MFAERCSRQQDNVQPDGTEGLIANDYDGRLLISNDYCRVKLRRAVLGNCNRKQTKH